MANIQTIADSEYFSLLNEDVDMTRKISTPFCCDLLSIAMGKAKSDCCWVTVMANINTLAVASLADVSCIILAEGVRFDDAAAAKATEQKIPVFMTDLPVFEAALHLFRFYEQTV